MLTLDVPTRVEAPTDEEEEMELECLRLGESHGLLERRTGWLQRGRSGFDG